jgi:hypothetical protein
VRSCGGGSSENRVNVTPVTASTRVWPGRKRARRGTCLRGWSEAPGSEEGVRWRGAARQRWRAIFTVGTRGKEKTGQRRSLPQGETPAAARGNRGAARRRRRRRPRCGSEGSGAARVHETRGGGCGSCGS